MLSIGLEMVHSLIFDLPVTICTRKNGSRSISLCFTKIKSFETHEMIANSLFFFLPCLGRHFCTGCQKNGRKPQTLKVDGYSLTVNQTSIFWSIFWAYGIPLLRLRQELRKGVQPTRAISCNGVVGKSALFV